MQQPSSSASSPSELSASHKQISLPANYETPTITTYTEAELLNALGPAHANISGNPDPDNIEDWWP